MKSVSSFSVHLDRFLTFIFNDFNSSFSIRSIVNSYHTLHVWDHICHHACFFDQHLLLCDTIFRWCWCNHNLSCKILSLLCWFSITKFWLKRMIRWLAILQYSRDNLSSFIIIVFQQCSSLLQNFCNIILASLLLHHYIFIITISSFLLHHFFFIVTTALSLLHHYFCIITSALWLLHHDFCIMTSALWLLHNLFTDVSSYVDCFLTSCCKWLMSASLNMFSLH